jgi:nitrogen fixation/metabolism regulation signal transduction histidine kinase
MLGKTERRLALVILLTAIVPLVVAIWMSNALFRQASSVWLNPDVDKQLDHGVQLFREYVRAEKARTRYQVESMAAKPELVRAVADKRDPTEALGRLLGETTDVEGLSVRAKDGASLGKAGRAAGALESSRRRVEVTRPIGGDREETLTVTFAIDRSYEQDLQHAGEVRAVYGQLVAGKEALFTGYLRAFAALLIGTAVVTIALGFVLARGVTKRIARIALAMRKLTSGDWSVRVPVTGSDEMTELASTFNRMSAELQASRARIAYLQRIEVWQQMAQRLAHEIKNPLTPIQLAVQQCHRKYDGQNPRYQELLNASVEIVEEEVGTLRRLVSNFSRFARLPSVERRKDDLVPFIDDIRSRPWTAEDGLGDDSTPATQVKWVVAEGAMPAAIDRQLLRLALGNLIRNATDSISMRGDRADKGVVRVSAHIEQGEAIVAVEDNGPGVAESVRERVFEPYVTTKAHGTGLGLAITMKIIAEHNGTLSVDTSPDLGGARFTITLPLA